MAMAAIDARQVAYSYDAVVAVDDVSLSLPTGSTAAILGPNGAGKTTFVRLVTGVLAPQAGQLSALGTAPVDLDRERLGVLPQSFTPPARHTPRELVTYYRGLYDRGRDPASVLADLELESVADRQYRRLSGGEQRRTCLGTALISDPDLLVLDEPTAGIDPVGKRTIWERLSTWVDDETTILVTTHDMMEAERLADRVGFFFDGRLLAYGEAEELVSERLGRRRLRIATATPGRVIDHLGRGEDRAEGVVLDAVDPSELPELIEAVIAVDPDARSIRWEAPPLEDLFVALQEEGLDR